MGWMEVMELGLVDLVDLTRLMFIDEEAGNFKVDGG